MIFSKIWQRMLFFRALKFILFFLVSIYLIYVVIDLSAHSGRLFSSSGSLVSIFFYYLHHFMARLDLFLPLSLLLATISLLSAMKILAADRHLVEAVRYRLGGMVLPELHPGVGVISPLIELAQRRAVLGHRQDGAAGEVDTDADHLVRGHVAGRQCLGNPARGLRGSRWGLAALCLVVARRRLTGASGR